MQGPVTSKRQSTSPPLKVELKTTPYQGIATFLKADPGNIGKKIDIVGIPFDGATSYRPGARMAPEAIRSASKMLTDGNHPVFNIDPTPYLRDRGDILTGSHIEDTLVAIEHFYSSYGVGGQDRSIFAMGGDHSVTLGILRGIAKRLYPDDETRVHDMNKMRLVVFDAHCDTWSSHFGEPRGHGTVIRDIVQEGIIRSENILQIGVRSPVDSEAKNWLVNNGGRPSISVRAANRNTEHIAGIIRNFLYDIDGEGGVTTCPWYLSIDIDAIDPSQAPGTGTPEIAGIFTAQMLEILEHIVPNSGPLVGADVVEVLPMMDPSHITALTAATLLWTIMAGHLKRIGIGNA